MTKEEKNAATQKEQMKYEIDNPSDRVFIEADDPKVACIATLLLGRGMYGLTEVGGDFGMPKTMFIDGDWFEIYFGNSAQAIFDATDKKALVAALNSVHLAGERSSMNDIVKKAKSLAKSLAE